MVAVLPLVILLILVGGFAGIIALIVNRSTRVIGVILLGLAMLMPILLLLFFFVRAVPVESPRMVAHEVVQTSPRVIAVPPVPPPPVRIEQAKPVKQAKSGNLLTALGHAVGAALSPKVRKAPAVVSAPPATTSAPPAGKPESKEPERPSWVGAAPKFIDNAYFMAVKVGPYTTRLECEANLPEALQSAVSDYVELYLGSEAAKRVRLPADELRQWLVREEWEEPVQSSIGRMVELHVHVAFDTKMQQTIKEAWRRAIIVDRLRRAGAGLAVVLGVLALAYTALRAGRRSEAIQTVPSPSGRG
jgi:hypothetical protein